MGILTRSEAIQLARMIPDSVRFGDAAMNGPAEVADLQGKTGSFLTGIVRAVTLSGMIHGKGCRHDTVVSRKINELAM